MNEKKINLQNCQPLSFDDGKIMVDQYVDLAKSGETPKWMPTYKDLPIHSLPEIHVLIANLIEARLKKGNSVLDLGAGTGALSLRLQDLGYTLTACDYVTSNFRLHTNVPFYQINLNHKFSDRIEGKYDCIVATEILEHIENPRHVIRECANLLNPGGILIVTTPNIESSFSLAIRLRNGYFSLFDESFYQRDGHITPITYSTLRHSLEEASFVFEHFETHGGFSPDPWWKLKLLIRGLDFLRRDPVISVGSSLIAVGRLHRAINAE